MSVSKSIKFDTPITIGGVRYDVALALSESDKEQGLMGVEQMDDDQGMLFVFNEAQPVSFWMKDTLIPLDIIFIGDNDEVISVTEGKPNDETPIEEEDVLYVLELNAGSGVEVGDELEFAEHLMKVLAPDGSTQMELKGGERIFSRKNTKTLIRMAKRAERTKSDTDYKRLGNKMFKYINKQDTQESEYVEAPD